MLVPDWNVHVLALCGTLTRHDTVSKKRYRVAHDQRTDGAIYRL